MARCKQTPCVRCLRLGQPRRASGLVHTPKLAVRSWREPALIENCGLSRGAIALSYPRRSCASGMGASSHSRAAAVRAAAAALTRQMRAGQRPRPAALAASPGLQARLQAPPLAAAAVHWRRQGSARPAASRAPLKARLARPLPRPRPRASAAQRAGVPAARHPGRWRAARAASVLLRAAPGAAPLECPAAPGSSLQAASGPQAAPPRHPLADPAAATAAPRAATAAAALPVIGLPPRPARRRRRCAGPGCCGPSRCRCCCRCCAPWRCPAPPSTSCSCRAQPPAAAPSQGTPAQRGGSRRRRLRQLARRGGSDSDCCCCCAVAAAGGGRLPASTRMPAASLPASQPAGRPTCARLWKSGSATMSKKPTCGQEGWRRGEAGVAQG
jgi:hypothetical protein